uniref:NADH-ubiquinone oxidoreductase chain 3 n=1 Tax=Euthalenessa festiva TaxID=2153328 RepID=A0A343W6J2_9ANNE|nr:NADH dehydrogenase subunit 3 [Euthalenessa festiva]
MNVSLLSLVIALLIPTLVLLIALIISARSSQDREKCSPFECGFDPKNNARIPFSLRFFLLAVIFLVFDIEIVLLMPAPFSVSWISSFYPLIGLLLFFLILIGGLLHEWREGTLDWTS